MGREKTLDRGLLWAVSRVRLVFARVPVYDEDLCLTTWAGETMHALFPRYYELRDAAGHAVAQGSSLWLLMDENTRRMECGCCSYGCPAHRPLVQTNKLAKAQLAAWQKLKKEQAEKEGAK